MLASVFLVLAIAGIFQRITIDDRGVVVERSLRRPRRIEWDEVRQVRWMRRAAVLRGDRTTVKVVWQLGQSTGDDERARERVRHHLAPHFDLSERPPAPQWTWASLRRIGLATCTVTLFCFGMYWGALTNPGQVRLWALLLMSPIVAAYLGALLLVLRENRKPDAPRGWRTRLA